MSNNTRLLKKPLFMAIGSALLVQACAIPTIETRDPDLSLPEKFSASNELSTGSSTGLGADKNNDASNGEAKIEWEAWFNDPYLTALVETAVTNNKEVAVLVQRINMASNEVYAREGEYLPSVSAGAAIETEKVGEYTGEGAVEEQLDIREGEAFPDPLANLKLGLNASWEVDIWHKLRDASKGASLEYLASIESKNFFITQLVSEVSRSYYELLALDNKLANIDATIKLQRNVIHLSLIHI